RKGKWMSLYNVLRTSVSGMEAQSFRLATVAENIANASTVGYKRADTQFSSLILQSGPQNYNSGAVTANVRYNVSMQGALTYTLSSTDLAVQGDGFFIVQDQRGGDFLTRAGSFVIDGQSGNLVNAAGFALLGYPSVDGQDVNITLNDTAGLERISTDFMNMRATPSTTGVYRANLDADALDVPAPTASANVAASQFTVKSSVVAYDDLGREVTLDVYWTKTAAETWELTIYNQADQAGGGGFPYASAALSQAELQFDPTTGSVNQFSTTLPAASGPTAVDPADPAMPAIVNVTVPGNSNPVALDVTNMTQLAAEYEPLQVAINGNAPATVQDVTVDNEGRVFAIYEDGTEVEFYRVPLANVPSPDQMRPLPGNVYGITNESGDIRVALPNDAGNGALITGALEQSNVELATELTDMIVSQRSYTANSKAFQTGDQLLEVLVNLKR
ncbi:MAG: flagellar hook protein FlgE, partial [Pseudomonadota bacterium]